MAFCKFITPRSGPLHSLRVGSSFQINRGWLFRWEVGMLFYRGGLESSTRVDAREFQKLFREGLSSRTKNVKCEPSTYRDLPPREPALIEAEFTRHNAGSFAKQPLSSRHIPQEARGTVAPVSGKLYGSYRKASFSKHQKSVFASLKPTFNA